MCASLYSEDTLCLNQIGGAETEVVPRASQASRERRCGVAGWQGLKIDNGDITDLMPHAREAPPALRITHFQEGEDDGDWHARMTYDM
jgi:hypothetical protein